VQISIVFNSGEIDTRTMVTMVVSTLLTSDGVKIEREIEAKVQGIEPKEFFQW